MNTEKSELLVELGVEEIPASMLEDATRQFARLLIESLKLQRLSSGKCNHWFTPRRIIVSLDDVPVKQDDLMETVTGPPRTVACDAEGALTKAAMAFAKKNGVPLSKLKIVKTAKGEYLTITRRVRGERTHKILQNDNYRYIKVDIISILCIFYGRAYMFSKTNKFCNFIFQIKSIYFV